MSHFTIEQSIQFALAHHREGRLNEAEGIYRRVISQQPGHAQAMALMGALALQTGRLPSAANWIGRAIAADPCVASYHCNLGEAHRRMEHVEEAIAAFRRAIELNPELAIAHNNLGIVLSDHGRWREAAAAFAEAIRIQPDCAPFHSNRGNALKELGELDAASAELRTAIELQPENAEAHNNLGVVLSAKGEDVAAVASYLKAIELNPRYGDAYTNMGNALFATGDADRAIAACRKAVEVAPEAPQAHWNLAVALLRTGNFEVGWPEHEWRLKTKLKFPVRPFPQPQWMGEELAGRTILLHCEQGFGDAIQNVRYVHLVAKRGGKIILECHPELRRLFNDFPHTDRVIARGEPLPAFDLHCPLSSLPFACRTTLNSIPADVPYLKPEPELARRWRDKIGSGGMKVGLVWAGNPTHPNDKTRSIMLQQLAPLAASGIEFHSLQKGPAASQLAAPAGLRVVDHLGELQNYADTAALISQLDLVIAVDTSVAHLSGALGRPTWVLIPFVADCRWLIGRSDSPWYPTMRLFRQHARERWDGAIEEMARELVKLSRDLESSGEPAGVALNG
jgi:tetratricopeptide (TPR) repeat protein